MTIDVLVGLAMQSYLCNGVAAYIMNVHVTRYLPLFYDSQDAYHTIEQHLENTKRKIQELLQDQEFPPAAALKPNLKDIYFAVGPTNTHWLAVKISNNGDIIVQNSRARSNYDVMTFYHSLLLPFTRASLQSMLKGTRACKEP